MQTLGKQGLGQYTAAVSQPCGRQGSPERDAYQGPLKAGSSPQSRLLTNLHWSTAGPDRGYGERKKHTLM